MSEELKNKLEQRLNRRSFLKGSAFAAAAITGAALLPTGAFAQDPPQEKKDEKKDETKDETAKQDAKKDEPVDEFKVTKKDENGKDYRVCPQCGYNMYKQDRTWTCENCGYSYTE